MDIFKIPNTGYSGTVEAYLPLTYEVSGSNPGPYAVKLVVAFNGRQFTVQNLDQISVLGPISLKDLN